MSIEKFQIEIKNEDSTVGHLTHLISYVFEVDTQRAFEYAEQLQSSETVIMPNDWILEVAESKVDECNILGNGNNMKFDVGIVGANAEMDEGTFGDLVAFLAESAGVSEEEVMDPDYGTLLIDTDNNPAFAKPVDDSPVLPDDEDNK